MSGLEKETLRISGYKELLRACDHAGQDTKRETRTTFRQVGDVVKVEAQREGSGRLGSLSPKTAEGLRTRVRLRGVAVEESLGRTTGARPDWGRVVKGRLEDALAAKEDEVERDLEQAIDRVADHFLHDQ